MGRLATREISLLPQILRHRVLRVYFLISIFGPDSGHLRNLLGESFGMVLRGREPGDGLTTDLWRLRNGIQLELLSRSDAEV